MKTKVILKISMDMTIPFDIAGYFFVLLSIDSFILHHLVPNGRWYALHFITNVMVCILTLETVIDIIQNPLYQNVDINFVVADITFALHLYHIVIFKNLELIDWIHHIVMCSILTFPYIYPNGKLVAKYLLFFMTGLPGGIDYFLLTLVKMGKINKMTEKYINTKLNIWLRSPGIIIGAYILYLRYANNLIGRDSNLLVVITIAGLIWNGQYFTERVIYNYGRTKI